MLILQEASTDWNSMQNEKDGKTVDDSFMPPSIFSCVCACIDQAGAVICVYLSHAEPSDAHLFDPGSDAMSEPQLPGCPLTGAQNLTDLPVWEAVLLGLQQQPLGYCATVGTDNK